MSNTYKACMAAQFALFILLMVRDLDNRSLASHHRTIPSVFIGLTTVGYGLCWFQIGRESVKTEGGTR